MAGCTFAPPIAGIEHQSRPSDASPALVAQRLRGLDDANAILKDKPCLQEIDVPGPAICATPRAYSHNRLPISTG